MTDTATNATNELKALAGLIDLLASDDGQPAIWENSWPIGSAGHVTLRLDNVVPNQLSIVERDRILSLAARLTNGFVHSWR
jgi:hypothetical protein